MKPLLILIFFLFSTISFSQKGGKFRLKKGRWISELQLNEKDILPFELIIEKQGKGHKFCVMNGDEKIRLDSTIIINDSVHARFPFFNSELVFHINNKKSISGYWQNFNKGNNYRIDFTSNRKKTARFANANRKKEGVNVNGRWEVEFEPNTDGSYPAIGIFNQNIHSNNLTGTFLTETGDYRYLAGNSIGDSIYLSCFDGSHAFLFKALNNNGILKGSFFSGSHWKSEWAAKRNESIELTSPNDLTYLKDKHFF